MTSSKNDPFTLSRELQHAYRETEIKFSELLPKGRFKEARQSWLSLYKRFIHAQNRLRRRLHKGGILHNLGITALFSNDVEWAFKYFVLAYSEDVASQQIGFAGDAEGAPAAKNLRALFGVDNALFRGVRKRVVDEVRKEIFLDPLDSFQDFLSLKLSKPEVREKIDQQRTKAFNISEIPGLWNRRVFIGGSYTTPRIDRLLEIKDIVSKRGYTPIFVRDFQDEGDLTPRRKSLILLHGCKYAIFDVTVDSGHIVELVEAREYDIETLGVYEELEGKKQTFSSMIKDLLHEEPKQFSNLTELEKIVDDFLS